MDPVTVTVDLNQLILSGLTIEEFFLCYVVYEGKQIQLKHYEKINGEINPEIYSVLILKGMCKSSIRNHKPRSPKYLTVTDRFTDIINRTDDHVDNWIDEWIDLWPRGATSGGYYIRGDKRTAKQKMKLFRKAYPEYDKNTIFEATNRYIMRMSIDNFKYSKLSHYFIMKESVSTLASECDLIVNDAKQINNGPKYGENEL